MCVVETKDFGLIAYLILKYDAKRIPTGCTVDNSKESIVLIKEYESSLFSTYNKLLKEIVKKG